MNETAETTEQPFLHRWIDALRSGKFKQGRGRLRIPHEDRHCCLGVACVLLKDEIPSIGEFMEQYPGATHLPEPVAAVLEAEGVPVDHGNIEVHVEGRREWVSNLNDRLGADRADFATIADLLEAEYVR